MGLFVSNNPFHLLINQYLKCIIVNIGVIILIHRFIVPIFLILRWILVMKQTVLPIKDSNVLHEVQDTLLHNFRAGRRNYTIFQVGKATLLRVSDVLRLKISDIFDEHGTVKPNAYIHDKRLVNLTTCT